MSSTIQHLSVYRGDDYPLPLNVAIVDGTLIGATLTMSVKRYADDPTHLLWLSSAAPSAAGSIAILDESSAHVDITHAALAAIPHGVYTYDVRVTFPDGKAQRVIGGRFEVLATPQGGSV